MFLERRLPGKPRAEVGDLFAFGDEFGTDDSLSSDLSMLLVLPSASANVVEDDSEISARVRLFRRLSRSLGRECSNREGSEAFFPLGSCSAVRRRRKMLSGDFPASMLG
jgi:hypothetical protein